MVRSWSCICIYLYVYYSFTVQHTRTEKTNPPCFAPPSSFLPPFSLSSMLRSEGVNFQTRRRRARATAALPSPSAIPNPPRLPLTRLVFFFQVIPTIFFFWFCFVVDQIQRFSPFACQCITLYVLKRFVLGFSFFLMG